MNERALRTLEYHKIINLLADCATSQAGRDLCLSLKPMTDLNAITTAQQQTADALSRIFQKGSVLPCKLAAVN